MKTQVINWKISVLIFAVLVLSFGIHSIGNAQNQPPKFTEGSGEVFNIREHRPSNQWSSRIGTVSAEDPDNDPLTLTIGSDNDEAAFRYKIVVNSVRIFLKAGSRLEYEIKQEHKIVISVSDGALTGEIVVRIRLEDHKVFSGHLSTTRSIAENTAAGTSIGNPVVASVGALLLAGGALKYRLEGTDAASFDIDSDTGQLKTKAALDYETKTSYSVKVVVYNDHFMDPIDVTINITDVSNEPVVVSNTAPTFKEGSSATRSIASTAAIGTNVGMALQIEDDAPAGAVYRLSGTDAASFSVEATTLGHGQLKTAAGLNKSPYSVTVTVTDSGGLSDSIDVTINVTGIGQVVDPPVVTPPYTVVRIVAQDRVIFNEIHNAANDTLDWIEIRNITNREVLLNTWEISIVHSQGENRDKDVDIVSFADLEYKLQPGELLLITNSQHTDTDLIRGQDIADPKSNRNVLPQYLVTENFHLPNTPYLLILRNQSDVNGTSDQIEDVAGNYYRQVEDDNTDIWPLRDTTRPYGDTQFLTQRKAWQRATPLRVGYDPLAWIETGYRSGLGYRPRSPESTSLGTPGYPSDVYADSIEKGQIVFSEIMYAANGYTEPQWIELYNTSETEIVNLEGWKLEVEAPEDETYSSFQVITLNRIEIMPNQTILLVTRKSRHSDSILAHQVYDLSEHHNDILQLDTYPRRLLGLTGFSLHLFSADQKDIEKVGNLDGQYGSDEPFWHLSYSERLGRNLGGRTKDKERVSLIRCFEDGKPLSGDEKRSWKRTADIEWGLEESLPYGIKTYYGNETDIGTPGYRAGTPLPVTLSAFSAEMMGAEVVINWTTESELENAGFNILRSQDKQGPFVKVNAALIQGAGTIGERNEYTWTDTTAKPNVAYYYQIEDVSFAGARQMLTTKRLKGILSASGKFTTQWATLKQ